MARVVSFLVVLVLLGTAVPGAADDAEVGHITGLVRSENGLPAYGVCVSWGEYAVDVQPDGRYQIDVIPDFAHHLYFYNCHDAAGYPYISRWFWGGGDDWATAKTITAAAGQTVQANITLPFASGSLPEFGAVAGVMRSDTPEIGRVFLINDAGEIYRGTSEGLIAQPGRETATYFVAAPPGEYRVFVIGAIGPDSFLPVYHGSHPRGFAVFYQEGRSVQITSGKYKSVDFDLLGADSVNSEHSSGPNLTIAPTPTRPGISLVPSVGLELNRVAIYPVDSETATLSNVLLMAFSDLRTTSPGRVRLMVPAGLLGSYDTDTIPVWLNHQSLPDCRSELDDDCITGREFAEESYGVVDVTVVDVRTTSGGIFHLGDRPQFYDAETSIFGGDILWLAGSGITKGCNQLGDLFCPDDSVTRGQMAAFLSRALGLTDRLDDPFHDDDGSIFEADIERLAAAGITMGCNPPVNDRFCPDDAVTRGQMAAFLVRALGYADDGGGNLFADDDGSVFESAIDRLATAGVTRGCNPPVNDKFCPGAEVTRGQMAAFLHRALGSA